MIVLGGLTGSSKTHILRYLQERGQQVVDLEKLANHKGSAFGALGEMPQPSTEHFANLLYNELKVIDLQTHFWVEDESRNIGTVFLSENFFLNMQEAPVIVLMMDMKLRLPRLIREYSVYPKEELILSIKRISKRLGGDNTRDALLAIERDDFAAAIEIALRYYDKAYQYGLKRKNSDKITIVGTDTDDVAENAMKVLDAAGKISWPHV